MWWFEALDQIIDPYTQQLADTACTALAYHGSECMLGIELPKNVTGQYFYIDSFASFCKLLIVPL